MPGTLPPPDPSSHPAPSTSVGAAASVGAGASVGASAPEIHTVRNADHAALAELPWHLPLAQWPETLLGGLPRGISRHVVRYVEIGDEVLAIKETDDAQATREFDILGALGNLDVPLVEARAVVGGRRTASGEALKGALITAYLEFSLPYRALFSRDLAEDTGGRLVDALAVLLVRLHLVGFYWGDVSLSNTLFRRDADAYAAYVVDAETGELHDQLSDGQRNMDLRIARMNIAGDFLDLQAAGLVAPETDPLAAGERLCESYNALWAELTRVEEFSVSERWRIDERIRRLNDLGFDLGELTVTTDIDGISLLVSPKVVEPNHHSRRLLRLTGIGANENQARAMLNDLDSFRSAPEIAEVDELDESQAARRWLDEVYKPLIQAIPENLTRKLEPGQIFYEFAEHRRTMARARQRDIPTMEAIAYFIVDYLANLPDEIRYVDSEKF
ncbi:DUF4032 domain-containing protein [Brevibacterium linens]|uniref:DUF4032 domain-containing protein n=2 Tax=Brevibacterium linens TaxID=1703 RepID=A0A2H1IT80_BRELN|nr:DUF4032 domain-containing protein [Brevibacterium linens]SMX78395.1 protein of unknown function (DUF4032) [Brevibacterium linens]SMX81323.1 protein of unknown function (DUF4032) [Brevibacterium linens ATCC 9172]